MSEMRRISYFDASRNARIAKTYKTEKSAGDRLRSLAKEEMECLFIPVSYASRDINLDKRRRHFMYLIGLGIYPLRFDMPDAGIGETSAFFDWDSLSDYDLVIFEEAASKDKSRTASCVLDALDRTAAVFLQPVG